MASGHRKRRSQRSHCIISDAHSSAPAEKRATDCATYCGGLRRTKMMETQNSPSPYSRLRLWKGPLANPADAGPSVRRLCLGNGHPDAGPALGVNLQNGASFQVTNLLVTGGINRPASLNNRGNVAGIVIGTVSCLTGIVLPKQPPAFAVSQNQVYNQSIGITRLSLLPGAWVQATSRRTTPENALQLRDRSGHARPGRGTQP